MRTKDIAEALAGRLDGDGAIEVDRVVHPGRVERASDLALAVSANAVRALAGTKAQAVVVSDKHPVPSGAFRAVITAGDARVTLAKLTALFDRGPSRDKGVHPTAIVAPDAVLGKDVGIGPYSVVGARSRIGDGTVIMSHVVVGADVGVGKQGLIHAGARIGDRCMIGDRVIVHPNAVVGSDGFSFAPDLMSATAFTAGVKLSRVHSLGNVEIGDDAEVGAGSTIDRATLDSTRIGNGTKIDNQVHIGHNVSVGESCLVCGKVGISGSVTIGNRVRIGGGVGIGDHLAVGDEAIIGAGSAVVTNIDARTFVSGYPAVEHSRAMERYIYASRLKRMYEKMDKMASRLDTLEQTKKEQGGGA
ncbi:MAG TPA: UDP-3-O-(3-hydroxymyristoyl)glucosamine N-acyltransferase [Pseudolabrys sp.]|nr:UDP-3-O-(3-hydroxymyristoyl)glucosamine N-acyltransferase [Pseudolabrys sp.]